MVVPGRIALLSYEAPTQNKVRVWDGSSWVLKTVSVWNGSTFVDADSVKIWDGSAWVNVAP